MTISHVQQSPARRGRHLLLALLGLCFGLVILAAPHAHAAVTTTVNDIAGLKSAVADANNSSGDTINIAPGAYQLDALLELKKPMTLAVVPGGGPAVIQAAPNKSVLKVSSTGVMVSGLEIRGGASAQTGGGILVTSTGVLNLDKSTVAGNSAAAGAGIHNQGTLTVQASTIANNATNKNGGKGGGILNDGTLNVTNSTITGNTADQGGGLSSSGSATLTYVTVASNTATNKPGGGADRNGGTMKIYRSILANNLAKGTTGGRDCSGTPDLLDLNLVSDRQGCNPIGEVIVADPKLGLLANNGGPTQTMALLPGSPAIDALQPAATRCLETVDQRGIHRPGGPGCDLGAYEHRVPVTLAISSFDAECLLPGCSVRSGVSRVAQSAIPLAALTGSTSGGSTASAQLGSIQLGSIQLGSIQLGAIQLGSIQLGAIQLGSIQLGSIQLGAIQLGAIQLGSIQLGAIQLGAIQLGSIQLSNVPVEGGWDAKLTGTALAGTPIQDLTLLDVLALDPDINLTLADIDLSGTQLGSIQLGAILLNDFPLDQLPLPAPYDGATTAAGRLYRWCQALGAANCALADITEYTGPADTRTPSVEDDQLTLLALSFAGIDLTTVPFAGAPLAGMAAGIQSAQLGAIQLGSIQLGAIQLGAIQLGAISTVSSILTCGSIASCGNALPNTPTLGDAARLGLLTGTLGDLIAGLVPGTDLPWQDLDLSSVPVAAIGIPTSPDPAFRYSVGLDLTGPTSDVSVTVNLPADFAYLGNVQPTSAAVIPSGSIVSFNLPALAPGHYTLSFLARAGITTGSMLATVRASAVAVGDSTNNASAGPITRALTVIEAFELGDGTTDVAPLTPGSGDLYIAHISTPGETDLYSFTVFDADAAAGRRLSIYLGNLEFDGDLVLFGPPIVPLRGAPSQMYAGVGEQTLGLVRSDNAVTAETLHDIPLTPPLPGMVIEAVSTHRHTRSELIETAALRAGTYYIQVSGYNGETSPKPYSLRTRLPAVPTLPVCPAYTPSQVSPGPAGFSDAGANTVVLVNYERLRQSYGSEAEALILWLNDSGNRTAMATLGFPMAVVPIEDGPGVAAAFAAWDTASGQCSVATANNVVRTIGAALDANTPPATKYVVIIGDDNQVPMARIADGAELSNERTYGQTFPGNNPLVTALGRGYLLTDDAYGAQRSIVVDGRELFIPTRAVGRLVEKPSEILEALKNFVSFGGIIDPDTIDAPALVTGYDFLSDGATAVANGLPAPPAKLINETWTKADLAAGLAAQAGPDGSCGDTGCLVSLNAHFDDHRALPARGDLLFLSSDIPSTVKRTLFFSMGCHAGLSVSDIQIGFPRPDDWAQTLSRNGALLVGNTGFGYGDTETVALSEQLMANFARRLQGSASIGEALMLAKQEYLQGTPLITPYDQKILQISTFYGLPMFKLSGAQASTSASLISASVNPSTGAFDLNLVIGFDLTQVVTSRGRLYTVEGETLNIVNQPVQPKVTLDIPAPSTPAVGIAHGVMITGLTSIDLGAFDPVYFRPTVDQSSIEPEPLVGEAHFPASPVAIPPVPQGSGIGQTLVVIPGQFRDPVAGTGIGTQRLFTRVAGTVNYSASTDFDPPTIISTTVTGTTVEVVVQGAGNDIDAITVLHRPLVAAGPVTWTLLPLIRVTGTNRWTGAVPGSGLQYFSQVRDMAGNVASSFNKGGDFNTASTAATSPVTLTVTSAQLIVNGWYTGAVNVAVSGGQGPTYYHSVDGSAFVAEPPSLVVTADGSHVVEGMDSLANRAATSFRIDQLPPVIAINSTPAAVFNGWNKPGVVVTATVSDGLGSGIASFTVNSAAVAGPMIVNTTTTLVFTAIDNVGHSTVSAPLEIKIDSTGPVLSALLTPAPNASGWNNTQPVNVMVVAADPQPPLSGDTGSGVSAPFAWILASGGSCNTPPPALAGQSGVVATEGTTTVCLYAKDNVGNESWSFVAVMIDLTPPIATINLATTPTINQPVTLLFTCSDALSGWASCTATVDGVAAAVGSPLPTTTGSHTIVVTATDNAGNTGTATKTYSPIYGVCPLFDVTKPFSGSGSNTIPLKIQLCDANRVNLSRPQITLVATKLDGTAPPPPYAGASNKPYEFRYDGNLAGYIYNFKPLAPLPAGPHTLSFVIQGDTSGTEYTIVFLTN
jgi:hypothetical protein